MTSGSLAPQLPRRGGRRITSLGLLSALGLVLAGAGTRRPSGRAQTPEPGAPPLETGSPSSLVRALGDAIAQVEALKAQVDDGNIVPKFGAKAQAIIDQAVRKAGSAALEMEHAVDGALKPLFLRQAALIRQKVDATVEILGKGDAISLAEEQFRAEARELLRPGGDWSLDLECSHLGCPLEVSERQRAAIAEEQARAARLQQATLGVIGKLQVQMEQLQQKVAGMRSGGSPWVLSTSYKIPNTPLQIAGRYEQGRANIELNLTPEKDPTSSDASFVEGIGPANLGVSFNLGI